MVLIYYGSGCSAFLHLSVFAQFCENRYFRTTLAAMELYKSESKFDMQCDSLTVRCFARFARMRRNFR